MNDSYDVMQVRLRGHKIKDTYDSHPVFRQDHCSICGSKTITACPSCNKKIKGSYIVKGVCAPYYPTKVKEYCYNCGKSYPWAGLLGGESIIEDPMKFIEFICERFHSFARQIRHRHNNRPTVDVTDEYDVQDLIHALLKIQVVDSARIFVEILP